MLVPAEDGDAISLTKVICNMLLSVEKPLGILLDTFRRVTRCRLKASYSNRVWSG